jgi:hypothetical protein
MTARMSRTIISATAFMSGARTAVLMTRVPMPLATRSNEAPNLSSRSRSRIFGASPSMVAFRSCWAVQAWVGFRLDSACQGWPCKNQAVHRRLAG